MVSKGTAILAIGLLGGTLAPQPVQGVRHITIAASEFFDGDFQPPEGCWHNQYGVLWTRTVPLLLPEGSVVKGIALYYHHHEGEYSTARLDLIKRFHAPPATPVATLEARVTEEGTVEFGLVESAELTIPVDMSSASYELAFVAGTGGSFCAIRVDYIPPSIFAVALPHISR